MLARIVVEPPRDPAHGDLSTNAAMVVAKPLGKNPREVAAALAAALQGRCRMWQPVEVAGPGFLNFRLADTGLARGAARRRASRAPTSAAPMWARARRSTSNTSRPIRPGRCMSGHTRGAVFGDALASLMAYSGYDVTREYYINDAGGQIDVLAQSAFLRYREALGETIEIPRGLYPGDYLVPVGAGACRTSSPARCAGMPEAEWLPIVKRARRSRP